jgi:uncharacterized protein (DUF736 family)
MNYKQRPTLTQRIKLFELIKEFAIKNDYNLTITKKQKNMTTNQPINKKGFLFKNESKKNENHPDYTGKIHINGKDYYLSAWVNTSKSGSKYMSVTIGNEVEPKVSEVDKPKKSQIDDLPF